MQTINPKVATVIRKNDKPEVIKALVSLGDLIDSLNSEVINLIRKNPTKYATVVKNIMEAKSINDITDETISFFANLKATEEAKIILLRFDLFEPIVKEMQKRNFENKEINKVINWTCNNFKYEVPQKFSDEIIYSNVAFKNSFSYLLSKSEYQNIRMLNMLFPKSDKTKKMYAEIEHEKKVRDYLNEASKIQEQHNTNEISQEEAISKLNTLNLINNSQPQNTQNEKIKENKQNKTRIFSRLSKDKNTQTNKKHKLKE